MITVYVPVGVPGSGAVVRAAGAPPQQPAHIAKASAVVFRGSQASLRRPIATPAKIARLIIQNTQGGGVTQPGGGTVRSLFARALVEGAVVVTITSTFAEL